ncbi:hypothetical protein CIRG_06804 [Coccidioides immitis RMSCC 2394]|uniref:NmrA-like domain-containing protein n=1 Tax=Coccidioides immitis RMSCC 2394 TaxID=404692 RepID=A0A0J6YJM0_COCIT|nr:hypothetical protein CIRG_06804 [Coccidioides immitis RMSCC 2394]
MVHIAIVGAGNVGREIVEELAAQGKHQITVFSRKAELPEFSNPGIAVKRVDYKNRDELVDSLKGVNTVLSFVSNDPESKTQKALIDACIAAGVRRFAPSEWGQRSDAYLPGQEFKREVHRYLQDINADRQVLEYCLFQPGLFMNYLAYPYKTTRYLHITPLFLSVKEKQAIQVDDGADWLVFTDIQDMAKVVARAIDYQGNWPEIGGMVGSRIKMKDLIKLVENVLGESLTIHTVKREDLEKGQAHLPWVPPLSHPKIPVEQQEAVARRIFPEFLMAGVRGDIDVEPSWNKIMPDYEFTDIEALLRRALPQKS